MPKGEGQWVYVIPLSRVYWGRRSNRASRAVKLVKSFVKRHTKADRVVITGEVNEFIWSRSIERPPRRVKVIVKVEEKEEEGGKTRIATVRLAGKRLKPGAYAPAKEEKERKEEKEEGAEEAAEEGAGAE